MRRSLLVFICQFLNAKSIAYQKRMFQASFCRQNAVLTEMDESLKALRTDHVDIWHLHGVEIRNRLIRAEDLLI
jgi:predicted aldo/keto reductase-like oxidoreductase